MSNLKLMTQQLEKAPSVRDALLIPFVKERFIKNYQAITGRKDGENRFASEIFHYTAILEEKPELKKGSKFSHFAAIVKAGTTGLSFSKEGQLYPILYGNIVKVQIGAHGKRELLRRMPNIRMIHEAQLVLKGDEFVHDKMNNKVVSHVAHADTSKNPDAIHLDKIYAAYCRILFNDNTFVDVVMYHDEIVKAKAKSKNKGDASVWETWPGQMARKSTYNRAYTLYYSAPQVEVTDFKEYEDKDEEDESITPHVVVDEGTGEVQDQQRETPPPPPPPQEQPRTQQQRAKQQPPVQEAKIVNESKDEMDTFLNG